MFHIGQKVVVLQSSLTKSIGPRNGSVGYVCTESNTREIKQCQVMALTMTIVFTRFGYEKNSRIERKAVIVVFPISQGRVAGQATAQKIAKDAVSSLIGKISASKSVAWRDEICMAMDSPIGMPIMVIAPASQKDNLMEVSDNLFNAWIKSQFEGQDIANFIRTNSFKGYRELPFSIDELKSIDYIDSLRREKQLFDSWLNTGTREQKIAMIAMINTAIRRSTNNVLIHIREQINRGMDRKNPNIPLLLSLLCGNGIVFDEELFNIVVRHCVVIDSKSKALSDSMSSAITVIGATASEYKELAATIA